MSSSPVIVNDNPRGQKYEHFTTSAGRNESFFLFLDNIYSPCSLDLSSRSICQGWGPCHPHPTPQRWARACKEHPGLGTVSVAGGELGGGVQVGKMGRAPLAGLRAPLLVTTLFPRAQHSARPLAQQLNAQTLAPGSPGLNPCSASLKQCNLQHAGLASLRLGFPIHKMGMTSLLQGLSGWMR